MTDLEIYQPATLAVPSALDIDSWIAVVDEVIKVANAIYDTPFVPEGLRGSVTAVSACILAGREMGIGPMTSLQNFHVIKGKVGQTALLMRSLIQSRGHKWEDVDVSDTRVVVKGCRKGESTWMEASFTADQAKRAGIDLGKYPQDKLYARATVRLARRKFADVIMGMPYSEEDLQDGETGEGTVTETNGRAPAIAAPPAQRTARRGRATAAPQIVPPAAAPSPPAPAGETPLPPLPGEEENPGPAASDRAEAAAGPVKPQDRGEREPAEKDYDTPGTITADQLTALLTIFSTKFGFTKDEKASARAACEKIIGRKLTGGTTGNMSRNEAGTVLDTLANWQKIAESRGDTPRDVMIAVLAEDQGKGAGA